MKKLALVFTLLLFTSSANAGTCPMLCGKIDSKMTEIMKIVQNELIWLEMG